MIKRTIKETIEEFDKDGKLVNRTIREETELDDGTYMTNSSYESVPLKMKNKQYKSGEKCDVCDNNTLCEPGDVVFSAQDTKELIKGTDKCYI